MSTSLTVASELVQIGTQTVTAVTAVVMAYLAWATYLKVPRQEASEQEVDVEIAEAEESLEIEIFPEKNELVIFETNSQRTRLAVEGDRLVCYLKNKNEDNIEKKQWSLTQKSIPRILEDDRIYVNFAHKPTVGLLNIGPRKNWLYSKSLFPNPEYLHSEVRQLLETARGNG